MEIEKIVQHSRTLKANREGKVPHLDGASFAVLIEQMLDQSGDTSNPVGLSKLFYTITGGNPYGAVYLYKEMDYKGSHKIVMNEIVAGVLKKPSRGATTR